MVKIGPNRSKFELQCLETENSSQIEMDCTTMGRTQTAIWGWAQTQKFRLGFGSGPRIFHMEADPDFSNGIWKWTEAQWAIAPESMYVGLPLTMRDH